MLSLHVQQNPPIDEVLGILKAWDSPSVKVFADPTYMLNLLARARQYKPTLKGLYRGWHGGDFGNSDEFMRFWNTCQSYGVDPVSQWIALDNITTLRETPNLWVESFLGVESFYGVDALETFYTFERERVIRLASMGLKASVINPYGGHSPDYALAQRVGLLDVVAQHDGRIGLEGYVPNLIENTWHGNAAQGYFKLTDVPHLLAERVYEKEANTWFLYRVGHDAYSELPPVYRGRIRFFLGEAGFYGRQHFEYLLPDEAGGGYKTGAGFWAKNNYFGQAPNLDEWVAQQYFRAELQYRQYADVLDGVHLFTYSLNEWDDCNIRGGVAEAMSRLYRGDSPQPEPLPEPDPLPDDNLLDELAEDLADAQRELDEAQDVLEQLRGGVG